MTEREKTLIDALDKTYFNHEKLAVYRSEIASMSYQEYYASLGIPDIDAFIKEG